MMTTFQDIYCLIKILLINTEECSETGTGVYPSFGGYPGYKDFVLNWTLWGDFVEKIHKNIPFYPQYFPNFSKIKNFNFEKKYTPLQWRQVTPQPDSSHFSWFDSVSDGEVPRWCLDPLSGVYLRQFTDHEMLTSLGQGRQSYLR